VTGLLTGYTLFSEDNISLAFSHKVLISFSVIYFPSFKVSIY
jgi:hypothetical protein